MRIRVRLGDWKEKCSWLDVPSAPGVYWIVTPKETEGMEIRFGPPDPKDAHMARYQPENLQQIYEENASPILYIGKAGGRGGLRQRLRQYRNTLFYGKDAHRGGRAIRQIVGFENLYLEYEVCKNCEAREHTLLTEFKHKNPGKGNYPVANHKG